MAPLKPDCLKCQHYFVTWDANFPRGCRAMGFRTKNIPSREVFLASGQECLLFTPKVARNGQGAG